MDYFNSPAIMLPMKFLNALKNSDPINLSNEKNTK